MPFKGGPADKIGNRYEAYYTISCFIDILREKAEMIHIEPPGFEGEGVEFYIVKNSKKEYYQIKRQQYYGNWTINSLKDVLKNFFKKLEDPEVKCHFVSSSSATELEGLIDRVSGSYYEGFKNRLTGPYLKAWESLIGILNQQGTENLVYDALKRIEVELISEEALKNKIDSILEYIISGDPSKIRSWLFEYVFDQIGSELTLDQLWEDLKLAGFHHTEWYKDQPVINSFNGINERYSRRIKAAESSSNPIIRESTNIILEKIKLKQDLIVTGSAGIGKSEVTSQVLSELKSEKINFFVFDIENNELAYSANKLGSNMELPGSPVNVLQNISQGKESVFIIEQLDSLSLIQGKKLGYMNCIYELIDQVKNYPNINLILVCRDFDLKNDKRLIKIQKRYDIEEIKIKPLNLEELKKFINDELDLDSSQFEEFQLEILRIPFNLKIFTEIIESGGSYLSFVSEIELYNEYWDVKNRYITSKLGREIEWETVINILCEHISEKQDLKAPKFILGKYSTDADIMVSEGVLTLDSNYYGFFHGSFFDYSFARIFVTNERNLLEFLLSEEQYLFKRSQVRQILSYKRSYTATLFDDYINDVESILNSPDVRLHIKILILELFSKFTNPNVNEWNLIEQFTVDKESTLYNNAWKAIFQSIYWFELLDSLDIIENNLASKDWDLVSRTMWFLYGVMEKTERVAELIEPYIGESSQWNELIIGYVRWADFSLGDKYYEILLVLIDNEIFENTKSPRNGDYWEDIQFTIYKLSKTHPNRTIEVIKHYLESKLKLTLMNGQTNPFSEKSGSIPVRSFEAKEFIEIATKSPNIFVEKILPIMLRLMELNANKKLQKPFKDEIWRDRGYKDSIFQNREILLQSMETALSKLSKDYPKLFTKWQYILLKSEFETAQYLLIRSYTANGEKYCSKAVDYLDKNRSGLKIGYFNAPLWASRMLIESISPHCLYTKFKKLENILLYYFNLQKSYYNWVCTFYPEYGDDYGYFEYRNATRQLILLEGIPLYLRSIAVKSRIKVLKQSFEVFSGKPSKMKAIRVKSPIKEDEAANFNDQEWIDAIAKYDKKHDILTGGPLELSRVLERFVEEDPERFVKLIMRFPDDTNVHYFNAMLRGIEKSKADLNNVMIVCERCHQLPNKPCGRWITQPIANFAGEKLPKEALEIVSYYVLNDPDPQKDLWDPKNSNKTLYYGGIYESGINSVRGTAALSFSRLLFNDKDLISITRPILEKIVKDPVITVRSCIAETLIGVLKYDRPLALQLFEELCETDDILLQTRHIEGFLFYNIHNFEKISKIINRMIFSEVKSVALVGSRLMSYAYINGKALLEFDFCLNVSELHRLGIAQVFSEYLSFSPPSKTNSILIRLFNDPYDKIRSKASSCFRNLNDENISSYHNLMESFIYSPAFKDNNHDLMYALDRIEILPEEITIDICERFSAISETFGKRNQSLSSTRTANIVFKLYNQTKEMEMQTRCLDLIDYMLMSDDYMTIHDKLFDYEH